MHRSSSAEPEADHIHGQSAADLLPHAPPMVLLHEVLASTAEHVSVSVPVRPDIAFFKEGFGVPVHIGIEYMAQACGVFVGLEAQKSGLPIKLGYLLGTRNFTATLDWFKPGGHLIVNARLFFRHEEMGVFDCQIVSDNNVVASAQLNLYQPQNAPEFSVISSETRPPGSHE